jgi:hypothetical protein
MHRTDTKQSLSLALFLSLALGASQTGFASEQDHREFEATLHAPYTAQAAQEARTFTLEFSYPFARQAQNVAWRLELIDAAQRVIQRWQGAERLTGKPVEVKVNWSGRAGDAALRDGVYQVRLVAVAVAAEAHAKGAPPADEVEALLDADGGEHIEQSWDIVVGEPDSVPMPAFAPLPTRAGAASTSSARSTNSSSATVSGATGTVQDSGARASVAATASLPYTIYYGNLHSQTNHSDGGGTLSSCTGAQNPQAGAYGPTDAFNYAKGKGLDFLMASEHNHMYDGSDSTNTAASPATAKSLYQSGLSAASSFNAANPNFLAIYGMEWGVITNGGHMNIFNSSELLEWEYNSSNQLIGDTYTAKSDYAALYTLMKTRGWIGQFNHPDTTGQFLVNGVPLGYTADGDQAMVLCEVLNTSAFSTNTTETETSRSSYEGACKKALEAGFHVAFSTDQDNHCANWGASYTNRTGVLIPTGTALSNASFIAALKARRVFATMDKTSQLVFTANGHVMGERFTNSGSLNLLANFASTSGKTASTVAIYEGVPGRNGTVTQLSSSASTTVTPAVGEHFYYAKITQNDGNSLWSAPIWVTQSATAPASTQLLANPGFESGATSWTASAGVISNDTTVASHGGSYKAWLNGYGAAHTDTLYQQVTIPSTATSATLAFWLQVQSDETTTTTAYDTLKVQVRNSSGAVLATLATYSNLNKGTSYVQKSFDLSAYKGQAVQVYFVGTEDSTVQTSFLLDDVTLTAQ